jgi:hypothetical protein
MSHPTGFEPRRGCDNLEWYFGTLPLLQRFRRYSKPSELARARNGSKPARTTSIEQSRPRRAEFFAPPGQELWTSHRPIRSFARSPCRPFAPSPILIRHSSRYAFVSRLSDSASRPALRKPWQSRCILCQHVDRRLQPPREHRSGSKRRAPTS